MRSFPRLVVSVLLLVAVVSACDPRPPDGVSVLHRINVGGAALDGGWSGDTAAEPSPYVTTDSYVVTARSTDAVDLGHGSMPPGVPEELFRTQRVDLPEEGSLRYDLPVPEGTVVQARVYLAETRHDSADLRRFDILIEGALAFDEVDVFSRAGGQDRGMVLWKEVTSDGSISIELAHGAVGDPSVAGIEIVSTSGSLPPDIEVTPTEIDFTGPYSSQLITVTNAAAPGSSSLVVGEPYLSGAGAAAFAFDGGDVTLLPGESTAVYAGIGDTHGMAVEAQLVIPSNDPDEPSVVVDLSS